MSPGAQNKKSDTTPSVTPTIFSGAENMKMGTDAHGTAESEFGSEKNENGTRRPQYRPKLFRARKK
jgi:hypothetical protein